MQTSIMCYRVDTGLATRIVQRRRRGRITPTSLQALESASLHRAHTTPLMAVSTQPPKTRGSPPQPPLAYPFRCNSVPLQYSERRERIALCSFSVRRCEQFCNQRPAELELLILTSLRRSPPLRERFARLRLFHFKSAFVVAVAFFGNRLPSADGER